MGQGMALVPQLEHVNFASRDVNVRNSEAALGDGTPRLELMYLFSCDQYL